MAKTSETKRLIDEISGQCLLGRVRRLSRVVTSIYEEELRAFGLKPSQFNLLVLIARAGPVRRIDIGRLADLDPSTLTRNLAPLLSEGWIAEVIEGEDGRGNPLAITDKGLSLIASTGGAWRRAQRRAHKTLGDDGAGLLLDLFRKPA
jgi:DNA-binding MarR family transcriptional regulator